MTDPSQFSSSTTGFFQETPTLRPVFSSPQESGTTGPEDDTLTRLLQIYLPANEYGPAARAHALSRKALDPDVLVHSVDAEINRPTLRSFDTFGKINKADPLWTAEGWRQLKRITQEEGMPAVAYENPGASYNKRVEQFALAHVWSCTSTMISCPIAMTDGAAKLLGSHLDDADGDQPGRLKVIKNVFYRLTSRNSSTAWTAAQWMTERVGGSDVSHTETVAEKLSEQGLAEANRASKYDGHGNLLGPWSIKGFKWFSSATDAEVSLMLAKTRNGLSLFMAPMRRTIEGQSTGRRTELNGVRIQRLKDKLGTKALPTAELELNGVRAWLIGREGGGVREISVILNLTRLHTAAGGVSAWSRALHISRAYSKVRKVRGGVLSENSMHLRWMAMNAVRYKAAAQFAFFCIAMLGALEQGWDIVVKPTSAAAIIPRDANLSALFRLLTPVLKAQVSVASVLGIREHMECLGGVGYCENNEDGGLFNLARIFRDNLVSPIWEGTVSVMAEDVVRVMTDKRMGNGKIIATTFVPWVRGVLKASMVRNADAVAAIEEMLGSLLHIEDTCGKEELLFRGRELLELLDKVVCSTLLMYDAHSNRDPVAAAVAQRYLSLANTKFSPKGNWKGISDMDKKIFLGVLNSSQAKL